MKKEKPPVWALLWRATVLMPIALLGFFAVILALLVHGVWGLCLLIYDPFWGALVLLGWAGGVWLLRHRITAYFRTDSHTVL